MSTFNGFGTMYFGSKKIEGQKGYIATKWFVMLWFPIVPTESSIILNEKSDSKTFPLPKTTTEYSIIEENMNWKQVFQTYKLSWGIAAIYITIYSLLPLASDLTTGLITISMIVHSFILRNFSINY